MERLVAGDNLGKTEGGKVWRSGDLEVVLVGREGPFGETALHTHTLYTISFSQWVTTTTVHRRPATAVSAAAQCLVPFQIT